MRFGGFFKIRDRQGNNTGYLVPRLYNVPFTLRELKHFGLLFVKERLAGWTIWTCDEADYDQTIKTLEDLAKLRIFEYKVLVRD